MNIGIAGGGLLGRLIAWRALLRGHTVTVYESGSLKNSPAAARTAAGMSAPLREVVVSERLIYDMGLESIRLWPDWLRQLGEAGGPPVTYAQAGSLAVAHAQDRRSSAARGAARSGSSNAANSAARKRATSASSAWARVT